MRHHAAFRSPRRPDLRTLPAHTQCATAVQVALLGLTVASGAALAQAPAAAVQQQLERVEVTGSSIKRIEGETALPVQVITREDIVRTGVSNVEQLMQTVSAATSSQNL